MSNLRFSTLKINFEKQVTQTENKENQLITNTSTTSTIADIKLQIINPFNQPAGKHKNTVLRNESIKQALSLLNSTQKIKNSVRKTSADLSVAKIDAYQLCSTDKPFLTNNRPTTPINAGVFNQYTSNVTSMLPIIDKNANILPQLENVAYIYKNKISSYSKEKIEQYKKEIHATQSLLTRAYNAIKSDEKYKWLKDAVNKEAKWARLYKKVSEQAYTK